VEAADTGPFFHNHTVKTVEDAVAFYGTPAFQSGLFSKFGLITVKISPDTKDPEVQAIAAFLRMYIRLALLTIRIPSTPRQIGVRRSLCERDA
jgi:cytochrome c peroxidase